tara:strand:- start:1325 stop:1816 length:492 start_codon:yes stop_codon:yes gene_type:complete
MTNKLGSANPKRISSLKKNCKIEEIYNYHKVPNLYETSGQPTRNQFKLLIEEDYEIVINLAQESVVGKVAFNEKNILESSKIEYIHIPVDFDNPKESDFEKFVSIIKKYKNKKLFVHCAANMRVSAFTYRYRRDILNLEHNEIIKDLEKIWKPNKVWKSFLNL